MRLSELQLSYHASITQSRRLREGFSLPVPLIPLPPPQFISCACYSSSLHGLSAPLVPPIRHLPMLARHVRLGGVASGRGVWLLARSACVYPFATSTKPSPSHSGYFSAAQIQQARSFSYTRLVMAAQKIDGTAIAKSIREKLNHEIAEKQKNTPRFKPALTIIQGQLVW